MKKRYNTLIIGSGCAGYNAAVRLYDLGITDIAILTEGKQKGTSRNTGSDKQTYYKLSLCGESGDSVREMAKTLYNGGGVMGEHALCEAAYSTRCFMHLCELGVPFPTNEFGEYAGYKTDHDPRERATSAGPLTSKYMTEALERAAEKRGIEILDGYRAIEILTKRNEVTGVACVSVTDGSLAVFACQSVILATGGPAGIYKDTVYPESQHGGTGLAIAAGAMLSNMEEWQYGLASVDFRWNVSGTYQQVLPRYFSVDAEGNEREFLYDALGKKANDLVFLKGYEWPFDTRKTNGSSQVDLLVFEESQKGRHVYMDFTKNPKGLDLSDLCAEAYSYLERSEALLGTPIERLEKMNGAAIALYQSHGIDLYKEPLRIAVCAQHCNGGIAVDAHWQSTVVGLYAAGEVAGTFGVYRPGGSALNSTQVGSLRAAEHIAKAPKRAYREPHFVMPTIRFGESNLGVLRKSLQEKMSRYAAFDRDTEEIKALFSEVSLLCDHFFDTAVIQDKSETAKLFMLYDAYLTARAALSAMLCSAGEIGTHGAAVVDRMPPKEKNEPRKTRTLTVGARSYTEAVSPLPDPPLWFETLLAKSIKEREARL
ncbi:MAG: FAD-binding protein [Clostridia bacterium]|nr:FAD-binding protein [Clostridia bacterium]